MKQALEERVETAWAILKLAGKRGSVEAYAAVQETLPILEAAERELRAALSPAERGKFMRALESVLFSASDRQRKRLIRLISGRAREIEGSESKASR